ncbi:MAG: hypothetical protein RLZZ234_778 [Candidatus Parcubacteria bacterium]|jgi:type IV pilus assembly protein PilA
MKNARRHALLGFTLIELLIVIGIIGVLAAIVLIAVNPSRQFAQANNAQRSANVNAILSAIGQYIVDHKGALPGDLSSNTAYEIADDDGSAPTSNVDICDDLVPAYIPALPQDPSHSGSAITCAAGYNTGYKASIDNNNRVTVSATGEAIDGLTPTISVTR